MKKILKWTGMILLGLAGVLVIAAAALIWSTNGRMAKTYSVDPDPVAIPTDPDSLALGERWAQMHCGTCHGPGLAGGEFFNDPQLGFADAPNLTSGAGGIGSTYTDADWVRALRHGIKADGTSVFIMPSNDFYYLSEADLGSIIAYVKSVPPVDNETRGRSLSPMAKILYALGAFGDLLYAEVIPHNAPRPAAPEPALSVEYGDYLTNVHGCKSCHGEQLSGKQPAEPGAPLAPNLTQGGELLVWSEADFIQTIRTGVTPTGHELSDSMPWKGLRNLTDAELQAIWVYLQSLPALETTTQ